MLRLLTQQPTPMHDEEVERCLPLHPRGGRARDRRWFNELLFAHYAGMSEDRLVCSQRGPEGQPPGVRGAKELVEQCRRSRLRVVFITGSLDITVGLSKELGGQSHNWLRCGGKATGGSPPVVAARQSRLIADDARSVGHDLAECHHRTPCPTSPCCRSSGTRSASTRTGGFGSGAGLRLAVLDIDRSSPGESSE